MRVTFCGHSKIQNSSEIAASLENVIHSLIAEGATEFYLGGYGEFDMLCARIVRDAKNIYPHIRSTLVIPYIDREFNPSLYDDSVYPPLESVPRKFAISRRNEWMIEYADVVVSYVIYDFGGAATTLKYATRKRKRIISLVRAQAFSYKD